MDNKAGHWHSGADHIIIGALGVFVVAHGARLGAAYLVRRGGRAATVGKVIGAVFSLPAIDTTAKAA
jgi:heme oxygenase